MRLTSALVRIGRTEDGFLGRIGEGDLGGGGCSEPVPVKDHVRCGTGRGPRVSQPLSRWRCKAAPAFSNAACQSPVVRGAPTIRRRTSLVKLSGVRASTAGAWPRCAARCWTNCA